MAEISPDLQAIIDTIPRQLPRTGPGRPSKLNRARVERFVQALATGHYREIAAQLAGMSWSTVRNWLELGQRQDTGPYRVFLSAVQMAEAHAENVHIQRVAAASVEPRNWTASAWLLERTRPERYARRGENMGQHGTQVQVMIGLALPGTPQAQSVIDASSTQTIEPARVSDIPALSHAVARSDKGDYGNLADVRETVKKPQP